MKQLLILLLLFIWNYATKAQVLEEWTSQKQAQIKYLLQQIAALHVYAESTLKGYKIVKHGLAIIQDIKYGDLHIHLTHINSLKQVNPAILRSAKMILISAMQAAMVKQYTNTLGDLKQHTELDNDELNYYQLICNKLLQQGIGNLTVLSQLTTENFYAMTNEERIQCIDGLYDDMQNMRAFLQSFNNYMISLCLQRLKEKEDLKTMQSMYGVK